jgi:hypothetical protein
MTHRSERAGKRALFVVVACGALTLAVPALAATSPWVKKADVVCGIWDKKAVAALGANPKPPTTAKGEFNFVVKARALESGQLHALEAIPPPRPAGVPHAFALARADIKEIDAGLAAYRAGKEAAFAHDVNVWQSDHRTSQAFINLGAIACA